MDDVATRSIVFRTSDGSVFYIGSHGEHLSSIVTVQWRGVDICADCFIRELDDDEKLELEADLRTRGARNV